MAIALGPYARLPSPQVKAGHSTANVSARSTPVCSILSLTHSCLTGFFRKDIEAEVRYAVSHEYAQTAIDVLARRTRLCFLNVHAALEALPRVVDIMADELHWSFAERQRQIANAVEFFASMGLPRAAVPVMPSPIPRDRLEKAWAWVTEYGFGRLAKEKNVVYEYASSRARFEPGELALLTAAFDRHAKQKEVVDGQLEEAIGMHQLSEAIREVSGYEGVTVKEFEYVLEEAGLKKKLVLDFDEFIEVGLHFSLFPLSV